MEKINNNCNSYEIIHDVFFDCEEEVIGVIDIYNKFLPISFITDSSYIHIYFSKKKYDSDSVYEAKKAIDAYQDDYISKLATVFPRELDRVQKRVFYK